MFLCFLCCVLFLFVFCFSIFIALYLDWRERKTYRDNHQSLLQPTFDTCLQAIGLKMQAHVVIECLHVSLRGEWGNPRQKVFSDKAIAAKREKMMWLHYSTVLATPRCVSAILSPCSYRLSLSSISDLWPLRPLNQLIPSALVGQSMLILTVLYFHQ